MSKNKKFSLFGNLEATTTMADNIHHQEMQIENDLLSIITGCKYHDVIDTAKQRIFDAAEDISSQTRYSLLEVLGKIRTCVSDGCSVEAAIQIVERKLIPKTNLFKENEKSENPKTNPALEVYTSPLPTGWEKR